MSSVVFLVLYFFAFTSSNQLVLNMNWTLLNENESIVVEKISLPSGVYSVLQENKLALNVLHSYNDVNLRWIAMDNWTYLTDFSVPEAVLRSKYVILTFHGVDTVALVHLNGARLGTMIGKVDKVEMDNMFTRYRFDVKQLLQSASDKSHLSIKILSPVTSAKALAQKNLITPPECPPDVYHGECHMNFLRKMQASFSWDWGPAVPSSGIWKPVVIEYYDTVLIRDITVRLHEDVELDVWLVEMIIYMEAGIGKNNIHGNLKAILVDFPDTQEDVTLDEESDNRGEFSYKMKLYVPRDDVELWWPNGYGRQKLYVLQVVFDPYGKSPLPLRQELVTKSVKIGFRTIELVQEVTNSDPTRGLSFFFRVNGVPIFMKGTNWIPSSILPEKSYTTSRIKQLLSAVKTSHMNMIRVWGGGVYESDLFYELTDTYGILIWHDLMFACAMYPVFPGFLISVREEVRQNVRRIQSHPSVAIWATNNENEVALVQNWYHTSHDRKRFEDEYRKLYIDVVKAEVEANDPWRECLSSSPSNGRHTETEGWISKDPQDWHYGDIHYYNYDLDAWDPTIYPKPRFVSEYGFQSLPSLEALDNILAFGDNMSQMIDHRQHSPLRNSPMNVLIRRHLPIEHLHGDPLDILEAFIYFSQVSQAMAVKTETEVYRANRNGPLNTMGALFWQLNDVWVAPSWSSIEFNGNFKILQYWVQQFMAPLHIIPLVDHRKNVHIYIVRDSLGVNQTFTVKLHLYNWAGFDVQLEKSWNLEMMENSAFLLDTLNFVDIFGSDVMEKSGFLFFRIEDYASRIISTNFIFPVKLRDAKGIRDPHIDVVIASTRCSFSVSQVSLEVKARAPAIFVYLQIYNPDILQYTLSKNGYLQLEPVQMIRLEFANENCSIQLMKRDIRILTLNDYLKSTQ
uniref:beta-mannosidase n=1 Tax=Nyssomyia neivai TaxID=330878 RepID=A0A1L8DQR0_9DIPT